MPARAFREPAGLGQPERGTRLGPRLPGELCAVHPGVCPACRGRRRAPGPVPGGKTDSYRIVGGNDLLAQRLAEDLDVHLGELVQLIDSSGPRVRVETAGGYWHADRVVVAVPGPLTTSIRFWPALPPEHVAGLAELTYGTATKLICSICRAATDCRLPRCGVVD